MPFNQGYSEINRSRYESGLPDRLKREALSKEMKVILRELIPQPVQTEHSYATESFGIVLDYENINIAKDSLTAVFMQRDDREEVFVGALNSDSYLVGRIVNPTAYLKLRLKPPEVGYLMQLDQQIDQGLRLIADHWVEIPLS